MEAARMFGVHGGVVRSGVAAVVLVGALGCKREAASERAATASAKDIADATAKTEQLEKARKAALAGARGTVVPRPDLGKCPIEVRSFGPPAGLGITGSKTAWGGFDVPRWKADRGTDILANFPDELASIERLGIAYVDEVGTKPGPRGFRLASLLRDKEPSRWQAEELLKTEKEHDFELIIDDETLPEVVGEDKFASGTMRARFYVWDYEKGAIVCAARALATNSDRLHATGTDQGAVDRQLKSGLTSDLREQALAEALKHLYAAGPPQADAEPASDAGARPKDAGKAEAGTKKK
jgi:hypothetical protein